MSTYVYLLQLYTIFHHNIIYREFLLKSKLIFLCFRNIKKTFIKCLARPNLLSCLPLDHRWTSTTQFYTATTESLTIVIAQFLLYHPSPQPSLRYDTCSAPPPPPVLSSCEVCRKSLRVSLNDQQ